jgi:hypothetical protein
MLVTKNSGPKNVKIFDVAAQAGYITDSSSIKPAENAVSINSNPRNPPAISDVASRHLSFPVRAIRAPVPWYRMYFSPMVTAHGVSIMLPCWFTLIIMEGYEQTICFNGCLRAYPRDNVVHPGYKH